jgi:hypothetical protein
VLAFAGGAVACSAEDVTGAPEDIGSLVHVVSSGSSCSRATPDGDLTVHLRLSNSDDDQHTVSITPRLRAADGDETGTSLEGFEVTVPGHGTAEGEGVVDHAPGDLARCFVRIDGGDDIAVRTDLATGG